MVKINNTNSINYTNICKSEGLSKSSDELIFKSDIPDNSNIEIKNQDKNNINKVPKFDFLVYQQNGKVDIEQINKKKNEYIENLKKQDCNIIENENGTWYINENTLINIQKNSFEYENSETNETYIVEYINNNCEITRKTPDKTEKVCINEKGDITESSIISAEDYIKELYDENGNILISENLKKNSAKEFLNGKEFKIKENDLITYPYISNLQNSLLNHKIIDLKELVADVATLRSSGNRELVELYKETTGRLLINDIAKCESLSDKDKKKLYQILEPDFGNMRLYKSPLELENEQVRNKHYTGDLFDIKYSGRYIEVKNKTTNKIATLNLNELLKNIDKNSDRNAIVKCIQSLPAEVIYDLAKEIKAIESINIKKDESGFKARAYYTDGTDTITLDAISPKIIAHELAHSIDNLYSEDEINYYASDCYNKFNVAFEEELNSYLSKGNEQFDNDNPRNIIEQIFKIDNYMTANNQEAFARCYEALLLDENYKIFKYFPRTLEAAKELLKELRETPENERVSNNNF